MNTCTQICSFEIEKYCMKMSNDTLREGFYIHLKDTDGNSATSEVSPFAGRSLETLDEAYENLTLLRNKFLENDLTPSPLYPSVMFGMQMALYSLGHSDPFTWPPIIKLYTKPPLFYGSFGPVKLKLGDYSLNEAIAFFKKFKRKEQTIRIDLERKWDIEKTVSFCKEIDTSSILYIEDPVMNYSDMEPFYKEAGVMYAIDQFLSFQPPERMKNLVGLHTIIVKPSLVGGIHECRELQKAFSGIPITFSSLYETKVGINHIKLISKILCGDAPVGVDTLKFLKPL